MTNSSWKLARSTGKCSLSAASSSACVKSGASCLGAMTKALGVLCTSCSSHSTCSCEVFGRPTPVVITRSPGDTQRQGSGRSTVCAQVMVRPIPAMPAATCSFSGSIAIRFCTVSIRSSRVTRIKQRTLHRQASIARISGMIYSQRSRALTSQPEPWPLPQCATRRRESKSNSQCVGLLGKLGSHRPRQDRINPYAVFSRCPVQCSGLCHGDHCGTARRIGQCRSAPMDATFTTAASEARKLGLLS
ncbi:hypothetical protein D3C81_1258200 [compost metagenome]